MALAAFAGRRWIGKLDKPIYCFDTLGLALFAAHGAERGIAHELGFWGTVFASTVSGVGSGAPPHEPLAHTRPSSRLRTKRRSAFPTGSMRRQAIAQ